DPKPQQVKKIFEALRRGLKEYLCVQQAELDYLSGRHKDTRRNSRLAFYYDLDKKQTRSVERHIRKMEFHISKVDELYEDYCIQCRLRDGASNMQQAFSRCPPSRASRESLQELGRSLHECTEDMWLIEGALEVHLGEFHVRMKGLVGYARLCPGDQYEVLMRLGRQRWKLKGRIESDDSQTWDEEEKAFVPALHENFEIKVTELRGLSSLAVGAVTCDITDFFTTRPQVIMVDITELGTIKLQLEVLWNPFDAESFLLSPSPTGKLSVGGRKGSLYSWTPPSTPSFRERYYLRWCQPSSMLGLVDKGVASLIHNYVPGFAPGPDLQGPGLHSRSQELPEMDSFSSEDPRDTETSTSASTSDVGFLPLALGPNTSIEEEAREDPPCPGLLPEMAQLAEGSFVERPGWRDLGVESSDLSRGSPLYSRMIPGSQEGQDEGETRDGVDGPGMAPEQPLQEVLELLRSTAPTQPPLRELEYQVLGFRDRLKRPCFADGMMTGQQTSVEGPLQPFPSKGPRTGCHGATEAWPGQIILIFCVSKFKYFEGLRVQVWHSGTHGSPQPRSARREHASAESLMECILESFAFLHADFAPDELSLFGGSQGPRFLLQETGSVSLHKQQAGAGSFDLCVTNAPRDQGSPPELTAGAPELDVLLTAHLQICKTWCMWKLASPNLSRMVQECLLEEAAEQKQVLETLSVLDFEKVSKATSIDEIIPQASRRKGCLKLWRGCTGLGGVLSCPATALLNQLKKTFLHRVRGKYPGQLEPVCRRLLDQVLSCGGLLPGAGPPEEQTVTWFQFHSYLQRQSVSDLEKHFAQLTKEVTLIAELQCTAQARVVKKLQGKRLGQLQPLPQTLHAWALLQLEGSPRVCRAASSRLASAARNKSFREKALLFYTNALTETDPKLQQAACVALKHLRGIESIDQIASLCQSDLEAVRAAAREATLSFGEKGRLAFEKMDRISSPKKEAFCQEADVEITVF
uniref:RIPOR family member 3 n=1 Tax=Loxodonta africana TaxID=9785 RepID=G3ULW1_LOXAF